MPRTPPTPAADHGLGPQPAREDPTSARLRFHQNWYRAEVLKAPIGFGPKASSKTPLGSMLTQADGERGLNFLTPHIFQVARRRLAARHTPLDPFRLLCSLASEQALAFNLFAPLVDNLDLSVRLIQALLPEHVERVEKIYFHYLPEPTNAYLNDRTTFDVFIDCTRPDRQPAFIALSFRLVEPYSPKVVSGPYYKKWVEHPESAFLPGSLPALETPETNQLWRDHLLATAMLLHPESSFAGGQFILLYPSQNSRVGETANRYRGLLRPEDETFRVLPLENLHETWKSLVSSPSQQAWLDAFHLRYLDLSASQEAFEKEFGSSG